MSRLPFIHRIVFWAKQMKILSRNQSWGCITKLEQLSLMVLYSLERKKYISTSRDNYNSILSCFFIFHQLLLLNLKKYQRSNNNKKNLEMSFIKYAALFAASASMASALDEALMIEMSVYMADIGANIMQYMSMMKANPNQSFPSVMLSAQAEQMTATNDSYLTWFKNLNSAEVEEMVTGVPWYSSRLAPKISKAWAAAGITEGAAATSVAATTTAATTTAATTSAASSSAAASSAAASSSSAAASSSSAAASSSASVEQVSSSASATHAVSQQTENGANKAVIGMGAGVIAAAAMLL